MELLLNHFDQLNEDLKHLLNDCPSIKNRALIVLHIAKDKFDISRLTSKQIQMLLEESGVSTPALSITRAFAGAKKSVSVKKESKDLISYKLMTTGKQSVQKLLEKIDSPGGVSIIRVECGKPRTARKDIREILSELNGDIYICDPYLGSRTFDTLDAIKTGTKVKFLTFTLSDAGRKFQRELKEYKVERPDTEFRRALRTAGIHDRYILSKDVIIFLGHGLKDIGSKESFVMQLDKNLASDLIQLTMNNFNKNWKVATAI